MVAASCGPVHREVFWTDGARACVRREGQDEALTPSAPASSPRRWPVAWVAAGRRAAYVTDGRLLNCEHFSSGIAPCQAAGAVVTGIKGQPVHTGVGGLVAAADRETHAALLALIGKQFRAAAGAP